VSEIRIRGQWEEDSAVDAGDENADLQRVAGWNQNPPERDGDPEGESLQYSSSPLLAPRGRRSVP